MILYVSYGPAPPLDRWILLWLLLLALSWTSGSTGCSGNLWCRQGIDSSHLVFREVVEGWSHVPLALAPIGVENPQCCMQFQRITSTWLKNCQSRQVAQVLQMSFCTSNSNKICSIMQPLRGVYGIQFGTIKAMQFCPLKSQPRRKILHDEESGLELQWL